MLLGTLESRLINIGCCGTQKIMAPNSSGELGPGSYETIVSRSELTKAFFFEETVNGLSGVITVMTNDHDCVIICKCGPDILL